MVPLLRTPTAEKSPVAAAATKMGTKSGGNRSLQSPPKLNRGIDALERAAAKAMQYSLKQSACLDGHGRGERDASIVGV
jgi:hypothetical protein